MSWRIEVKPSAEKQYLKLDRTTRRRIKAYLRELESADRPLLHLRLRPLTGKLKGDHRVRIGDWRVLLTPDREASVLHVYAILSGGDACFPRRRPCRCQYDACSKVFVGSTTQMVSGSAIREGRMVDLIYHSSYDPKSGAEAVEPVGLERRRVWSEPWPSTSRTRRLSDWPKRSLA
jgi:mRNA-degrading endonuclease RelE of RelBE toxin-antitoxin system